MRLSRGWEPLTPTEKQAQKQAMKDCGKVTAFFLVVIMVCAVIFAAPKPAHANTNCLSPQENTWDCRIPPRFEGISAAKYGEVAYVCARGGEIDRFLWLKNFRGFPNLRTCIDFELLLVDRNPQGRLKYAVDFYKHYGVDAREFNRQVNYIMGLVRYLAAAGDGGRIIVTPLFCRTLGMAGGPVTSVACSYVAAYWVIVSQPG